MGGSDRRKVAVVAGSESDLPLVRECLGTLSEFGVEFDAVICSAHRTPRKAAEFASNAEQNGYGVIIAVAGKAAHLAGVLASYTVLPVIGIPVKSSALDGMDALLSMVQMPPGVPVATVAIDGAANAAILAVQILAMTDSSLNKKLKEYKVRLEKKIDGQNSGLAQKLGINYSNDMEDDMDDDKPKDQCGVFGVYNADCHDVARLAYYALYALQHRGQESAGIAVNDNGTIVYHKDMGLVPEVFNDVVLNHLKGNAAIGHVRYSTMGGNSRENSQPIVVKYRNGQMAIAHNGNIFNASELRRRMEESGAIFQAANDSEVIANLISRNLITSGSIEDAIPLMMKELRGSYSLVILTPDKLIGIRDSFGIRPLCIGRLENSYVLASESCALDAINAEFIRDVSPGEIVTIDDNGLHSVQTGKAPGTSLCIFEFVYLARPDSYIDGASVYQARIEAGKMLAIEHPVDADLVIGAPDGGLNAALGYSMQSGIPYGQGLIKNRYVGRTFIQPDQGRRDLGVKIKFNAMRAVVEGKRLVMVDDSIVRGTTTRRIVQMLKSAGAKEVHLRISSPPYLHPCHFGIDTPTRNQLLASGQSIEDIKRTVGADSIGYLSLKGLLKSPRGITSGLCTACFTGCYPMEVPDEGDKFILN